MSLIVDEHRQYLSDVPRLSAFKRAVRELLRPGDVVADVGSGTGILGLFALEAGASRVHSIESTGMIELGRSIAAANGFAGRFHAIQGHSTEVDLPELVDLLVSDFVGRFGFDAGIFEIYPDAARRWLRPGGRLLPSRLSMFLAPVERGDMHAQVRFWETPCAGFDVTPGFTWAVNTGYPVALGPGDLLGAPAEAVNLPVDRPAPASVRAELELRVSREGTLHGLGGWASAALSPSVTLTNSPLAEDRIARRNVFLPLARPVAVQPGDIVRVRFGLRAAEIIVSWRVDLPSRPDAMRPESHSTLSGMLVSRDDLRRTSPDFVPVLTPRGEGRLTTLQLCDGRRSLREVEDLVYARHPALFASRAQASAFVAEVVSGYARP